MSRFAGLRNHGRACIAVCVSAGFLWALALSASPQLHARIHADANGTEHVCAITLIASGSCEHVAQPPLVGAPQFKIRFPVSAALTPTWVKPLFLNAHIFAHAPPALHA